MGMQRDEGMGLWCNEIMSTKVWDISYMPKDICEELQWKTCQRKNEKGTNGHTIQSGHEI